MVSGRLGINRILPLSFQQKEDLLSKGLSLYLDAVVGEYFDEKQIQSLPSVMKDFRTRSADVDFSEEFCKEISPYDILRNRFLPHKTLRKDELAILFYNLAPYALVSRCCMSKIAKSCFPNFFASASTINSTFTKYQFKQETSKGREVSLTISNLSERSTAEIEGYFLELALNTDNEL